MFSNFLHKVRDFAVSVRETAKSIIDIVDAIFNIKRVWTSKTQLT